MQDPSLTPPLSAQLLAAAQSIRAVLAGQSLSEHLAQTPPTLRPAAQALSFHAMRHLGFAQAVARELVPRKPAEPLVHALTLLGLCLMDASLQHDDGQVLARGTPLYPAHTLVHQMVAAAESHRRSKGAKGLINAVLRRYGRECAAWRVRVAEQPEARWNHPEWWITTLQHAWPDDWQHILLAAQQPPPMTLRANRRALTREALQQQLQTAGIPCRPVTEDGLILDTPHPVREIPGYDQGWWSVQDSSAQQAGPLLPLADGQHVLDACAAPGGKTAHLLERHALRLTALDSDASRLTRVADNLQRLHLQSADITLQCADAATPQAWWDGQAFDAILADVPCTASGIVRRHPDIRWLRRARDLTHTAALQARIVDALWPTLAPDGHLLYATCSIFPQEGESQARAFLERHPDARRLPAPGHILPGNTQEGDGFFYALFAKTC